MEKVVVFTGAGISAESGLDTFRDNNGLWNNYRIEDVATPQAFAANPQLVIDFYNMRQRDALVAQPNAAHLALAELEQDFDVTVITQNVDNLHERAGSTKVVHLHGMLDQARSSVDETLVYPLNGQPITLGQTCELGSQLRPNIVWFGEYTQNLELAAQIISQTDKVIVVGTSLAVYPAAGLIDLAPTASEKFLITKAIDSVPAGYQYLQGSACELVPKLINSL
jgi:NAD-dependent deacetylase